MLPFKIVAHPLIPDSLPRYRLKPGDYIGPEFRARMDAWCDDFFGRYAPIFITAGGTHITGQRVLGMIRADVPSQVTSKGD